MIKKISKATYQYVKDASRSMFLQFYYNKQIKTVFLKKNDKLDKEFEKSITSYWGQFGIKINKDWHKWYSSRNGFKDVKYIPEDIFYNKILPRYNRLEFKKAYCDKTQLKNIVPHIKTPKNLVNNLSGVNYDDNMNILSQDEVIDICSKKNKLYIKPSIDSGGGRSIIILEADNIGDMSREIRELLKTNLQNFVIQEEIVQHDILNKINKTSINTIRPISFFDGKDVHILSSVLRMGVNGAKTDNETSGGISCGVKENGELRSVAYDRYGNVYTQHPQGFIFDNTKIPSYEKIKEVIKREHKKFGHFKIISWDFAIDTIGEPILIEYNLGMQAINFHQMNNGPLFGELTDNLLGDLKK